LLPRDDALVRDLGRVLAPERVLSRPLDLLGRSVDASIYRLIPRAVVRPRDLAEVRGLLEYARGHRRHLTFRTAGTSLSGQAVTDDILVELAPFWKGVRVLDGGARVWCQPGVVGGYVNRLLAPLGRRLGPDPASIDACMMGGIVANNSSGMCCGVAQNSYHTLRSMAVLLADGTLVDTSGPDADTALRRDRPRLHADLARLRDEVRGDGVLCGKIRRKFARKNTTGYSLNALLDHDAPAEILARLMIGSQGTLGFLAEMTLDTVPEPPARATGLLFFGDLAEAGAAVLPLAAAGAAALEIMDAGSLRSQAEDRAYPFALQERTAAVLVEFREGDEASLQAAVARGHAALGPFRLLAAADFTTDAADRDRHWRLRKGLFPSVGGMRPSGTAVVIEDVVVPVERLAEAVADLQALFARHGFLEAIVFGHARDGNLHFVFAQDFQDKAAVARYAAFMRELVDLVVGKYDGAIKAEHGSGRNMAPFVRDEWGEAAYAVMRRVKRLLDPDGILNPGVLLNDDPEVHLKDLKPLPPISPLADRCIECGFCEPRCPSRDLTLTPRQRIVVAREVARLGALGAEAVAWRESLLADFAYEGDETCAKDSMCQTSCPVKIDTGAMVKEMRAASQRPWQRGLAWLLAGHYGAVAAAARGGLRTAALLRALPGGAGLISAITSLVHDAATSVVPHVAPDVALPRPAPPLPPPRPSRGGRRVVYFPSCLTRIVGRIPGEGAAPLAGAMLDVLEAAGLDAVYPEGVARLCCGMPFASKAFAPAARRAAARAGEALWAASRGGRDTVVTDASPCAGTLQDLAVGPLARDGCPMRVLDFPSFWAAEVLPTLADPPRRPGLAVLHPTCTLVRMGGLPDLLRVARAHGADAVVPAGAECCGFAGDRGFLVPELTRSATAMEAAEVRGLADQPGVGFYSTCRTCEIGMSRGVGREYRSLVHFVREAMLGG
jgi:D-lactate dehydrogenase